MPYWRLYYHITWATKNRYPFLTPEIEPLVYPLLIAKARELGAVVYAINGVVDHIHIAAAVPPRIALSEWVQQLKGSSSRVINLNAEEFVLKWQPGYGIVSLGQKNLQTVVNYILRQKEHHARHTLIPFLEAEEDNANGPIENTPNLDKR